MIVVRKLKNKACHPRNRCKNEHWNCFNLNINIFQCIRERSTAFRFYSWLAIYHLHSNNIFGAYAHHSFPCCARFLNARGKRYTCSDSSHNFIYKLFAIPRPPSLSSDIVYVHCRHSGNYCLWKLRTFGEFFHHFMNIKRTIQTYVSDIFRCFCIANSKPLKMSVLCNYIVFAMVIENFMLFSYIFVINTIILLFNGPLLSKNGAQFSNKNRYNPFIWCVFFCLKFELTVNYRELRFFLQNVMA